MTVTTFLMLLAAFSTITALVTEAIKKLVTDKRNLSCNLVALITALIVGSAGTATYYVLTGVPFTVNNIIYIILLGLASGLAATVGYDKVMQTVKQLTSKTAVISEDTEKAEA